MPFQLLFRVKHPFLDRIFGDAEQQRNLFVGQFLIKDQALNFLMFG